jgi:hypothetical protein
MVTEIVGPMATAKFKLLLLLLDSTHMIREYKLHRTMRTENTIREIW